MRGRDPGGAEELKTLGDTWRANAKPQARRTEVEMGAQQPGVEPAGVRTMAPPDGREAQRSKRGGGSRQPETRMSEASMASMDQGGADGLEPKADVESGVWISEVDQGG